MTSRTDPGTSCAPGGHPPQRRRTLRTAATRPREIGPLNPLPTNKAGELISRLSVTASKHTLIPVLSTRPGIVRLLREFDDDPTRPAGSAPVTRAKAVMEPVLPQRDRACRNRRSPRTTTDGPMSFAFHGTVRESGTAHSGNTHQLRDEQRGRPQPRRRTTATPPRHAITPPPMSSQAINGSDTDIGSSGSSLALPSPKYSSIDGPWSLATWSDSGCLQQSCLNCPGMLPDEARGCSNT